MHGTNKLLVMQGLGEYFKEYKTGTVSYELRRDEELLKDYNRWDASVEDINTYKALECQRNNLLQVEEIIWRKKSMRVWLKHGNGNMKFFHRKADQRRKTNTINKLKDDNGYWWRGDIKCERVLVKYFSDIFSSFIPTNIQEVCLLVQGKLRPEPIRWCEESFTPREVEEALFQMNLLKAHGPDGIPALFFQKFLHIVGPDVSKTVLEVLNNNKDLGLINNIHIALIPKCKNPFIPKYLQPISLCNRVMKLVTNMIANIIKHILHDIIDKEQSTFVKGRLITNNVLVAMECFYWMKKNTKGKCGVMAFKLDMSKAYDRLEWSFITEVLSSMGFPISLVNLIKNCISSVSYKDLINGKPSMSFPLRGVSDKGTSPHYTYSFYVMMLLQVC